MSEGQIKADCLECKGTGMIRFFFDCDSTKDAPCPECFPEEKHIYEEINCCFMNIPEEEMV